MRKYQIILYWSDKDQVYIADVPELTYCTAHGDTYEEALKEVQAAMELWHEVAEERDKVLPEIKGRRLTSAEAAVSEV